MTIGRMSMASGRKYLFRVSTAALPAATKSPPTKVIHSRHKTKLNINAKENLSNGNWSYELKRKLE